MDEMYNVAVHPYSGLPSKWRTVRCFHIPTSYGLDVYRGSRILLQKLQLGVYADFPRTLLPLTSEPLTRR
jgi:hypothetical protein